MTLAHRRADFRALVESGATILVPGVPHALSARIAEERQALVRKRFFDEMEERFPG
jgi:2-methylisocitrate lyase-like PEP mutase family enzyme